LLKKVSKNAVNKLILVCDDIVKAETPIEGYLIRYQATHEIDAGRMFCCFLCKNRLESMQSLVEIAEFYKKFSAVPEGLIISKLKNYQ
jgi:hypothetical protein